jgi:hypothetical protein
MNTIERRGFWLSLLGVAILGFLGQRIFGSEDREPISMSAEEFSRLALADQRALLARVFQHRLDHAHNIYYELESRYQAYENHNGEPGKADPGAAGSRVQYRHWRLGNSYRMDRNAYRSVESQEVVEWVSFGFNGGEGVGRGRVQLYEHQGEKKTLRAFGRIDTQQDTLTLDRYIFWLDGVYPDEETYLFRYLLRCAPELEIKVPVADGKVQLVVGWKPGKPIYAKRPGKRTLLLDPQRGFLPVRVESRVDDGVDEHGKHLWWAGTLTVDQSKLVGDVWMPTIVTDRTSSCALPEVLSCVVFRVSQIEQGRVKPADLEVPFTKGMQVVDAIKDVTYFTDEKGNPLGKITPLRGSPGAAVPLKASKSWIWRWSIGLVGLGFVLTCAALLRFRGRKAKGG